MTDLGKAALIIELMELQNRLDEMAPTLNTRIRDFVKRDLDSASYCIKFGDTYSYAGLYLSGARESLRVLGQ